MTISPCQKSILSPDLDYGELPPDPTNCAVHIEVEIGPKDSDGADIFNFTVVTPRNLDGQEPQWGRGLFIVNTFEWEKVERAIQRLLMHCSGNTWEEVSVQLNKELGWEFENYQEHEAKNTKNEI